MANNTLILSDEIVVTAAIGNSTTVNNATVVRVYNDDLTQDEVLKNYNSEVNRF